MNVKPTVIYKTALAVFKDKKMLLVRTSKNAEVFFTLGGKIEPGETELESLHREVKEEVSAAINPDSLVYLREFETPAYGRENTLVNIKLYTGELLDDPQPSSEVVEVCYFNSTIPEKHLTDMTRQILPWLKEQGYIL